MNRLDDGAALVLLKQAGVDYSKICVCLLLKPMVVDMGWLYSISQRSNPRFSGICSHMIKGLADLGEVLHESYWLESLLWSVVIHCCFLRY